jgi:hypothetical protein
MAASQVGWTVHVGLKVIGPELVIGVRSRDFEEFNGFVGAHSVADRKQYQRALRDRRFVHSRT